MTWKPQTSGICGITWSVHHPRHRISLANIDIAPPRRHQQHLSTRLRTKSKRKAASGRLVGSRCIRTTASGKARFGGSIEVGHAVEKHYEVFRRQEGSGGDLSAPDGSFRRGRSDGIGADLQRKSRDQFGVDAG